MALRLERKDRLQMIPTDALARLILSLTISQSIASHLHLGKPTTAASF